MARFAFGRQKVNRNWKPGAANCDGCEDSGWGAWQLVGRYSYVDLDDNGINGSVVHGMTLGVNWYLNTSAKLQFNYDYTRRSDTNVPAGGAVSAFGIRSAFDF